MTRRSAALGFNAPSKNDMAHYGVKGMRWGVRKDPSAGVSSNNGQGGGGAIEMDPEEMSEADLVGAAAVLNGSITLDDIDDDELSERTSGVLSMAYWSNLASSKFNGVMSDVFSRGAELLNPILSQGRYDSLNDRAADYATDARTASRKSSTAEQVLNNFGQQPRLNVGSARTGSHYTVQTIARNGVAVNEAPQHYGTRAGQTESAAAVQNNPTPSSYESSVRSAQAGVDSREENKRNTRRARSSGARAN